MPAGSRPQPPVGTARVAIHTTTSGLPDAVNVLWFNLAASAHVQADLDALVDLIATAFHTRFSAYLQTGSSIGEARASWITAAGAVLESDRSYALANGGGAAIANAATCIVVNWHITDYYRGGKPRTYLARVPGTATGDGRTVIAAERANVAASANGFIGDCNAMTTGAISAVTFGVVRFQSASGWLIPPVFRPFTGASVRSVLGTQRRRLGK